MPKTDERPADMDLKHLLNRKRKLKFQLGEVEKRLGLLTLKKKELEEDQWEKRTDLRRKRSMLEDKKEHFEQLLERTIKAIRKRRRAGGN